MSKKIMFQGTGSTVGKSLITAAFCRILKDKGYSVAPFKSQNMSLNSFVTPDGKEMGRAQVVQAEAARITPSALMNPILLKPTGDMGSQVIVLGKVFSQLKAVDYYKKKELLMTEVLKAYRALEETYEVLVIEGAGSPAEINLRKNDIVNMGLAEAVDAPVILIGDIDKGGVFASIYGTYMLLSPSEQKRIKGYMINKFRGDIELLKPGIEMFSKKLPIPCLGVIPYDDFQIDDEDSVTERFHQRQEGAIQIGVVKLPYMSNFTDFTIFDLEPDVSVRYLTSKDDFSEVDMLIIPGSKNTLSDRKYLKETGLDDKIYDCHKREVPIIGICGGYQILGKVIMDPYGVESDKVYEEGLGLLACKTQLASEKRTVQAKGYWLSDFKNGAKTNGATVYGYEIHMGRTVREETVKPLIQLENGELDGSVNEDRTVFGTYMHGVFDDKDFREKLLLAIRTKKGLKNAKAIDYDQMKEEAYNHLAGVVEKSVDLDKIIEIIEESEDKR